MKTQTEIVIDTIRQTLEAGYAVETWCSGCGSFKPDLDLPRMIREGRGDKRLRDLFIHCEKCQTRLQYTLRPPSRFSATAKSAETEAAGRPSAPAQFHRIR